jgi:hypothetical protein
VEFRVRRRIAVAAAALVLGALLAGCGMSRAGTAATVDGLTMSVSTVQSQTAGYFDHYSVNEDYCPSKQKVAALQVENFVRALVADRAAEQNDIVVTDADVDNYISSSGGIGRIEAAIAQRCLPPDESLARTEVRSALQQQAIMATAPAGADDFEIAKTLTDALSAASTSMDITVNPRYGEWNNNIVTAVNGSISILPSQASATPTPTQTPAAPVPGSGG